MVKKDDQRASQRGSRLLDKDHRRTKELGRALSVIAGWSSPVARQAHNLKVRGSNPLPATNFFHHATLNGLDAARSL
jgi:hypothetical protein